MSKSSRLGGLNGTFDMGSAEIPPHRFVMTLHATALATDGDGSLVGGVSGDETTPASDEGGCSVWLRNAGGVNLIEMADSAPAGAGIQVATGGKGTAAGTGEVVARLLEAASGDGSIVRFVWL